MKQLCSLETKKNINTPAFEFSVYEFENKKLLFYKLLKYILGEYRGKSKKHDVFCSILDSLFSKKHLQNILQKDDEKIPKIKSDSSSIFYQMAAISIQRWFRKYLYLKIIKYNRYSMKNEEDPFTFDKIEEIPINLRFSFEDKNHFYCFNVEEFHFFIENVGKWNPYTKYPISDQVLRYLNFFIYYNNICTDAKTEYNWLTETHAYVEVSQKIEAAGFYNDVRWFQKFSFNTCENIVKLFRNWFSDQDTEFFTDSFQMLPDTYVFDFCKEVLRLFSNCDEHYLTCCNFVKVLALNSDDFYNNLPDWLLQIESPVSVLDSYSDMGLYFLYIDFLPINEYVDEYNHDYSIENFNE
jgi:hypothetical protein